MMAARHTSVRDTLHSRADSAPLTGHMPLGQRSPLPPPGPRLGLGPWPGWVPEAGLSLGPRGAPHTPRWPGPGSGGAALPPLDLGPVLSGVLGVRLLG